MPCELLGCCQFFKDNMQGMPKSAEYIKAKLCFGDYEACNRFRIYKESGLGAVPHNFDYDDTEQVKKIQQCLRTKHDNNGN